MYAYAYNDPVNFRDPMGLSADDDDHEPKVEGTPGTPPSPGNRGNTQGGSGEQPCPECTVTAPRISGITIEHLLMEQFFDDLQTALNNHIQIVAPGSTGGKDKACATPESLSDLANDALGALGLAVGGLEALEKMAADAPPLSRKMDRFRARQARVGSVSNIEKLGRGLLGISYAISLYNIGEVAVKSDFDSKAIFREIVVQGSVFSGGALASWGGAQTGAAVAPMPQSKAGGALMGFFIGSIAYGMTGAAAETEERARELFDQIYDQRHCRSER